MWIERCSNRKCARPYQVNEFGGDTGEDPLPSEIICPHCGWGETRWSLSTFLAHALSAEQERAFMQSADRMYQVTADGTKA